MKWTTRNQNSEKRGLAVLKAQKIKSREKSERHLYPF